MSYFSDQFITDCDRRTADDDILDQRDGVSSAPATSLDTIRDAVAQMENEQCDQDFAQPQPDDLGGPGGIDLYAAAFEDDTFHFTRSQLNDLLFATIDMYLEFRDMHEHDAENARFEAVDEMFQGLDADRELAENDPTERLRLQLA